MATSNSSVLRRRAHPSTWGALRPFFAHRLCARNTGGFTLIELMIVVAIIGVLATVALPTMIKYVRRSKTTEAPMNLRKMYDASVMYYASEHSDNKGRVIPRRFPRTVSATPSGGGTTSLCCLTPGGKCVPNAAYWEQSTWNALHFSVDDPFYFTYQYRSSGQDDDADFTATAHSDLDCDGVQSTYERSGFTNAGIIGSAAVFIANDIE